MSMLTVLRETLGGFKSLLVGMRITAREAAKPLITVQYPHETLKMPGRFRGHVKLILDPATGKSRCTACNLCVRACPSDCIDVEGLKREGEKKKSVTEYVLDFTTCSLCGSCVEACPSDAIEYSKDYNVVSRNREDFGRIDLVKNLQGEAAVWTKNHPTPQPAPATAASTGLPAAGNPVAASPSASASAPTTPASASASAATVSSVPATTPPVAGSATTVGAPPQVPEQKST